MRSVSSSVKKNMREWNEQMVFAIFGISVDRVAVLVRHEVLGGEELVARGDDGGLDVALEGLDGLNLWLNGFMDPPKNGAHAVVHSARRRRRGTRVVALLAPSE